MLLPELKEADDFAQEVFEGHGLVNRDGQIAHGRVAAGRLENLAGFAFFQAAVGGRAEPKRDQKREARCLASHLRFG